MNLHYKLLVMMLLSLFIMGVYSCSGDDIEPEPAPLPVPDKVTLNTQSLTVESTESSVSLTITSNKAWTATTDQSWCTISKVSGGSGTTTINLIISANVEDKERIATITVKAGTATATVSVKQKEADPAIDLDNTSFNVSSDAGTISLKLTTNKKWTASSDQSWCKLSATEGEAGTFDLTISYDVNPDEAERTATLTILAGTATSTVTVKQVGEEAKIELDNTIFNVEANSGIFYLKVTANKSWTAISDQSWCKLSVTQGKEGTVYIIVSYETNSDESERTATITFNAGTATTTVMVRQKEEEAKIGLNSTLFPVSSETGKVQLQLTANKRWTASSDQSWCKLSVIEGNAGSYNLDVIYEANPNDTKRIATITVKAGTAIAAIVVKQAPKDNGNIENLPNKDWE